MPADFVYKEVETRNFTLASRQKVTNPAAPYKIYIEGDGYAFNAREPAFDDDSPNVIYLARPCQYIKSGICSNVIERLPVLLLKLLMPNMRQLKILSVTMTKLCHLF